MRQIGKYIENKEKRHNQIIVLTMALSVTIFFAIFALLLTKNSLLQNIDDNVTNFFFLNRVRFLDYFFVTISYLGETRVIALFCLILLFLKNRKDVGLPIISVTAFSAFLNFAIKIAVKRARPEGFFLTEPTLFCDMPSGFSFPSGHAQTASVFYFLIAIFFAQNLSGKNKKMVMVFYTIFCILMCIARVYLGVHFLSDVVAGLCLAVAIDLFSIVLLKSKQMFFEYL